MIYFKNNGEIIEKYNVTFDKEKLDELNKNIINNCSFIQHKEFRSDYSPRFSNKDLIKNFKYSYVGEKEYLEETRDVYLYSYDEYIPPYLAQLIDRLLRDDVTVVDEILNYNISNESQIDDRINMLNNKLIQIGDKDINKKKLLLKELENLLNIKDLNQGQQSTDLYYNSLMELIKFDLVDLLNTRELTKVEVFLGIQLTNKVMVSESENKVFIKSLKKCE